MRLLTSVTVTCSLHPMRSAWSMGLVRAADRVGCTECEEVETKVKSGLWCSKCPPLVIVIVIMFIVV